MTHPQLSSHHFISVPSLLALQLILRHREGLIQQLLFLLDMTRLQPRRHARTWISASIHTMPSVMMLRMVQQRLNSWLHETPRPSIERLLLTPHDRLRVGVLIEVVTELRPWEGIHLLDARDRDIFATFGFAVFDDGGVDLACAHDDAINAVMRVDGAGFVGRVGNDPLEV